ncbi:phosphoribosylamine--glycine ligase [Lutispora thermophila]|uniref:Phosphoribosylamine--glycine ligase n=1 Tax=Lutispora thermophila DSM 19022 TaxID=1122184 RepID=A0A1M6AXS4_9FIRM|nr:phosphoribosylamine--glycine ligase [Lutispora thermophila]SHI41250.1 phosphoribosylamine--glycine ligase [Lutispora thermophila DSM 19022]
MKVLVVGSGGREHALVWKLLQSPKVNYIYCAPGNGGIKQMAECVDIEADDIEGLCRFAKKQRIDLTVVGPELPLSLGIVDAFEKEGLRIFGPRKNAAILESSKAFAKDFMQKYGIPTAKYNTYEDPDKAKEDIGSFGLPVVIKADGLAAGKGVIIANTKEEALNAIDTMMTDKHFGEAGNKVVIEEFIQGKEASILAFVDGKTAVPMVSAQDYKRVFDDDKGLNTGGMGAISPVPHYDEKVEADVMQRIIKPTVEAMNKENRPYKGVLYFGLMITNEGPKVIEYNCRFGDPETEAVLLRLESDLVEIMEAVIEERLHEVEIKWSSNAAMCVVMASGGYPGSFRKGYEINGLEKEEQGIIFHAGTKYIDGKTVTNGGRVLVFGALGRTLEEARAIVYGDMEKVSFTDCHYRRDIGLVK